MRVEGASPHYGKAHHWALGLVFKAHRLVYHSTLGLGVIKKKKSPGGGHGLRVEGASPHCGMAHHWVLQGYLAHKKQRPPRTLQ